ncbi:MAG: MutS-related protein [Bacteriovoracaceae bacterium]
MISKPSDQHIKETMDSSFNESTQSSVNWSLFENKIIQLAHLKYFTAQSLKKKSFEPETVQSWHNRIEEILDQYDSYLDIQNSIRASLEPDFNAYEYLQNRATLFESTIESINEIVKYLEIIKQYDQVDFNLSENSLGFISEFRRTISPTGDINFEKSPRFRHLFQAIDQIETEARQKIKGLIRKFDSKGLLQTDQHDILNDHFVVALKSDHFNKTLGRIVGRSAKMRTLYLEPFEMQELSVEYALAKSKLQEEIHQFENENINFLIKNQDELKKGIFKVLETDFEIAKAKFCKENHLNRPILSNEKTFHIKEIFHPLIENPIKNSFQIKDQTISLTISGPNTGGKSVFLKSIALMYSFTSRGLFVPAQYAEIFWPKQFFFLSHQNENIEEGLSSFSGELNQFLRAIENSKGQKVIIFADELFNSTSSEEASSIAYSLIKEVTQVANAFVFVTTHHFHLKQLSEGDKQIQTCHFDFNYAENRPNYNLIWGESGDSKAIEILKSQSYDGLKRVLNTCYESLNSSLIDFEEQKEKLKNKEIGVKKLKEEVERLKKHYQKKINQLDQSYLQEKERQSKKAQKEVTKMLEQAKTALKEVKEGKKAKINEIYRANVSLSGKELTLNQAPIVSKPAGEILEGKSYFSNLLQTNVKVLELGRKKDARVEASGKKIWVKLSDLAVASNQKKHKNSSNSKKKTAVHSMNLKTDYQIKLDCRGMRLEEFEKRIEEALQGLYLEAIPFLEVVHGHGEGVLKKALFDRIKNDSEISYDIPDGNDGCTILKLS